MPFFVTGTKSPKVLASAFIFKHVYTQSMTYFVLLLHYLESPKMRHHLELVTMDWMIHLFLFCIYFCVNVRKTCKHACLQSCIDTCNTQTHWLKEAHTQLGTNKHTHIHTHTQTHTNTQCYSVCSSFCLYLGHCREEASCLSVPLDNGSCLDNAEVLFSAVMYRITAQHSQ